MKDVVNVVFTQPHTTEICEKRFGDVDIVKYRAPYGSKHAKALMIEVDTVGRKHGYFYRHVC